MLRTRLLRRSVLAALGIAALAPSTASASCDGRNRLPAGASDLGAYEHSIRCLINAERRMRGRAMLRPNALLATAGAAHADDMVERGYFSHRSLAGAEPGERLRRVGYTARGPQVARFGEILAYGTLQNARPAAIVAMWMASSGHRRVIPEPSFAEVGPGATLRTPRDDDQPGVTVAVEFGRAT